MNKKKINKKAWLVPVLSMALLVPSALPVMAAANDPILVKSVEFIGMDAPNTAKDMAMTYTTASVLVNYTDGTSKSFPLNYKTLMKSTDVINGIPAGVAMDVNGKPIMDNSVPSQPTPFISDSPDANALMKIDGAAATSKGGNPLSLLTHYEYITKDNADKSAYGLVPASISLSTIDQNKLTGELSATDLKKVSFVNVDGLWIPCNGSVTPWNTFLSSEEYDADARDYEKDATKTYISSFTKYYFQDDAKKGNPYAYGYIPEITVKADNSSSVVKHYSMGRFSHELAKVAPDKKTVFFGDDGKNTMLFTYIADKAEDLSAGTLYAAKWIQKTDSDGGSADLTWIKLGHATDQEIKSYVDQGLKFSDLFETADKDTSGFTKINTYPSNKTEWIKVKPGMEKAAAFLESRRFGAIQGATSEFSKMEGVALNAKDKKVYIAISYLKDGMLKDVKNEEPRDDIQLKKINAGVTYELSLKSAQKDMNGELINSEYIAANMVGLVVGEDLEKADAFGNTAVVDKVSNPDNLSYSEDMRTLFIGEDSGTHANNFLWAYQVDTKKLSRILSIPAGAEATGLQAVDDMNGFSYIMSNLQHPGDEMILPAPLKSEVEKLIDANYDKKRSGLVGYISGMPAMKTKFATSLGDKPNNGSVIVRDLVETQGAAVKWDANEMTATISKGAKTLLLKVGDTKATLNGQVKQLSDKIVIINSRLMAPTDLINDFLSK